MERVAEAMRKINRRNFLPDSKKNLADFDGPISIGYGQTNSQPCTVRRMLEWLDVYEGQNVLDIGSGSGWTSALLAWLVGESGYVHAVELVPELVEMGRKNCDRLGIKNVEFHQASASFGLSEHGPYDRILVSASANELPDDLVSQLRAPGKMVIPVKTIIYELTKNETGRVNKRKHPGFLFVPLIRM